MLKQASNHTYENCGKKCKNLDHGDKISRALVNSSLNDEKLAAYIAKTCRNYAHVFDHQVWNFEQLFFSLWQIQLKLMCFVWFNCSIQGQTALHVATATHKHALVEWLINSVSIASELMRKPTNFWLFSLVLQGADANLPDKRLGEWTFTNLNQKGEFCWPICSSPMFQVKRPCIVPLLTDILTLHCCCSAMVHHLKWMIWNQNRRCNIAASQKTMSHTSNRR